MNELSLFSGCGGGVLGTKLLGFKHIGYVEWDDYCQRVLAQRIKDGILDEAPIFGDIRAFIREGYAASYTGMVDVLTAGFPCQPFSVAGKRKGVDDERNMWPATIECVRIIRPKFCLLENVPGLLTHEYFGTILGDLAESGYGVQWTCLGADDIGANPRRKRLWILAYSNGFHNRRWRGQEGKTKEIPKIDRETGQLRVIGGASEISSILAGEKYIPWANDGHDDGDIPDAKSTKRKQSGHPRTGRCGLTDSRDLRDSNSRDRDKRTKQKMAGRQETKSKRNSGGHWWSVEPDVGRVAHGVASRVDRLKAIGNGQVPAVVKTVWRLLTKQD